MSKFSWTQKFWKNTMYDDKFDSICILQGEGSICGHPYWNAILYAFPMEMKAHCESIKILMSNGQISLIQIAKAHLLFLF